MSSFEQHFGTDGVQPHVGTVQVGGCSGPLRIVRARCGSLRTGFGGRYSLPEEGSIEIATQKVSRCVNGEFLMGRSLTLGLVMRVGRGKFDGARSSDVDRAPPILDKAWTQQIERLHVHRQAHQHIPHQVAAPAHAATVTPGSRLCALRCVGVGAHQPGGARPPQDSTQKILVRPACRRIPDRPENT